MVNNLRTFEAFVAERYSALARTAALLLGSPTRAEALVQSALARTYLRWDRFESLSNAEAYTRTVMVRLALRWGRRLGRGPQLADAADEVASCLARLPAAPRAALVLRCYARFSEAEAARMLRRRPATIQRRTARAMASLRAAGLLASFDGSPPTVAAEDWYVR